MLHSERRTFIGQVGRRAAESGPTVLEGYAAVFNRETVIGSWFREVILPGAFTDSVAADDICCQFNHDPNYILGRTANRTARVEEDSTGLRYECDLNADDPQAQSVAAKIERKDVTGSSFMFVVEHDDDEEWVRDDPAKLPLRKIKRAKLFDVGPVTMPAYEDTTASARAQARAKTLAEIADPPVAEAGAPSAPPEDEARAAAAVSAREMLERELALEELEA